MPGRSSTTCRPFCEKYSHRKLYGGCTMRNRLMFLVVTLLLAIMVVPALAQAPEATNALSLTVLGRYTTDLFDEGAQEIVAYHPASQTLYTVNAAAVTLDLISVADPAPPPDHRDRHDPVRRQRQQRGGLW
ncbi:hypothetical protein HC928_25740 [bacterium]|nr:hypothetical protein [bacterium]